MDAFEIERPRPHIRLPLGYMSVRLYSAADGRRDSLTVKVYKGDELQTSFRVFADDLEAAITAAVDLNHGRV